jgi:uncharacterized repeat protein (TIGR01451 family)
MFFTSYIITINSNTMKIFLSIFAFLAITSFAFGQLTVNLSVINCTCSGSCDGVINTNVIGGTSPYTYYWHSDTVPVTQTTATVTNLCASTYFVTVTDNLGLTATAYAQVTQPAPYNINFQVINPSCPTCCDGSITTMASGGTPPYTYAWSNSSNTPSLSSLCYGIYTVTIVNANGCTYASSVQLPETSTNCQAQFYTDSVNIDSSGTQGSIYFFNYSNPNNNSVITNYYWDFGDGYTATSLSADTEHIYMPGTYMACLTINTSTGCSSTYCHSIYVSPPPTLTGFVYIDANGNCTKDVGEQGLPNQSVKLTQGSTVYWAWTDGSGYYSFNEPTGTYTVEIPTSSGYSISCSNSQPHSVTLTTGSPIEENYAVNCNGFDLSVSNILFMDTLFPGDQIIIAPYVGLNNSWCNFSGTPGQVMMVLNPLLIYNGPAYGTPTPTVSIASTGDTLKWNVADIQSLEINYFNFAVYVTISTFAQLGDSACVTTIVLPTTGDVNPVNNIFTRCVEIGVSCDPNMKEVSPQGIGTSGNIPPTSDYLTFTVYFQNTGTASAHNIYVVDSLSNNLDISTLEIVASSHLMNKSFLPGNVLRFDFTNIMLPDSTSNEPLSHGSVTYKIKIKQNLPEGTQIKNTAYIYFDFNAPVITNTTLNTIATPQNIVEEKVALNAISIYPNPTSDILNISTSFEENENISVKITDVTGKIIHSEIISVSKGLYVHPLKLKGIADGIYVVNITSKNLDFSKKLIIK